VSDGERQKKIKTGKFERKGKKRKEKKKRKNRKKKFGLIIIINFIILLLHQRLNGIEDGLFFLFYF